MPHSGSADGEGSGKGASSTLLRRREWRLGPARTRERDHGGARDGGSRLGGRRDALCATERARAATAAGQAVSFGRVRSRPEPRSVVVWMELPLWCLVRF